MQARRAAFLRWRDDGFWVGGVSCLIQRPHRLDPYLADHDFQLISYQRRRKALDMIVHYWRRIQNSERQEMLKEKL